MNITGSTRKRADAFSPEENLVAVQLPAGKGHADVPEAEMEHVNPYSKEPSKEVPENNTSQLKYQLRQCLQEIDKCESDISNLVAKIDHEKNVISHIINHI